MTLPSIHPTREQWLTTAHNELRPAFEVAGAKLPPNIRLTCGFPSDAKRSGAIGECWIDSASADKTYEILISPVIADPQKVFEVVIHELCHTARGSFNHGVNFQKIASAMLLEPVNPAKRNAWGSTTCANGFIQAYGEIIDSLGLYPHAELSFNNKKKQGTRMLKAYCPSCGYTVRLTSKWASYGLPTCPVDGDLFTV